MDILQVGPSLTVMLGTIAGLLVLATVGYWVVKQANPNQDLAKIGLRLRFWWILTAVFGLSFAFGQTVLFLAIAIISFLALKEFLSMTPTRRADRRVLFLAYLAIPIQFYLIRIGASGLFFFFIPVFVFLFLPLAMALVGEPRGFLSAYGTLNWGLMVTVYSLGYVAYLLQLPTDDALAAGGSGLVLFLIVLAQFSEVAQYLFGQLFGRRKIMPHISTTKTWGGLIGGIMATAVVARLIGPLLTPFTVSQAIAIGIIVAVTGFSGYITLTAIKRDLQLKDRASMVPGHGGVLNRIGSLIFTAPLFFYLVYVL
jgi:phosphatidate cytidylyltransferase